MLILFMLKHTAMAFNIIVYIKFYQVDHQVHQVAI